MKDPNLTYEEAAQSPCLSCQNSPCCTLLPLKTFHVDNFLKLDEIGYYLGFEDVRITLNVNSQWQVFLNRPCRHLDQEKRLCTIHNKPNQPSVCRHYNPYHCHYKKIESALHERHDEIIWINEPRLQYIKSLLRFDDHRQLTAWPESKSLFRSLSEIPYNENMNWTYDAKVFTDEKKESLILSGNQEANADPNPCSNCKAYCCEYLVFPVEFPRTYKTFDFYRYTIGFFGVELGISNNQWTIIVKAKCRHLTTDHHCSIFGQPERPLTCSYYDAHQCSYKPQFGLKSLQGFLRLQSDEFNTASESFVFDDYGNLKEYPDTEHLRTKLATQKAK